MAAHQYTNIYDNNVTNHPIMTMYGMHVYEQQVKMDVSFQNKIDLDHWVSPPLVNWWYEPCIHKNYRLMI